MAKFTLWWVKWNGSNYESRMIVGDRKATPKDFRERGFDRIVVLDGERRGSRAIPIRTMIPGEMMGKNSRGGWQITSPESLYI